MAIGVLGVGTSKPFTATGNISPIPGALLGFFVSSSTSGTITVYDSATTTTTTKLVDTFTGVAGTFYNIPITTANGLYVVVTGTISALAVVS